MSDKKLTQLESLALSKAYESLESFNNFDGNFYGILKNLLEENGIEPLVSNKIADKFYDKFRIEEKKVTEAKKWINALISHTK